MWPDWYKNEKENKKKEWCDMTVINVQLGRKILIMTYPKFFCVVYSQKTPKSSLISQTKWPSVFSIPL